MKNVLIIICLAAPLVTACSPVYKIDIQQGNVVRQQDLNQVKPGMTKEQVQFLLGTPLIRDAFHSERWDYVYSYEKGGKKTAHKRLSLYFTADGKLARLEGDMHPQPAAAAAADSAANATAPAAPDPSSSAH